MNKVILATGNKDKLREIKSILSDFEVISMAEAGFHDDIPENEETFEGNALTKAMAIWEKTGEIVLADDSGFCVDYLNGAPGVYSARYAGEDKNYEDNNKKILKELADVPKEKRGAKFVCAVAICYPDGTNETVRGELLGEVTEEAIGENGFGYDPVFYIEQAGKTLAQMNFEEKNAISHRKQAFEKAAKKLNEYFARK